MNPFGSGYLPLHVLSEETQQRFLDQERLLRDAGPLACSAEALEQWKAQPTQSAPEDGQQKGDPTSHYTHYAGDATTLSLPHNCLFETCYAVQP